MRVVERFSFGDIIPRNDRASVMSSSLETREGSYDYNSSFLFFSFFKS
jgi:hypothetical protein